MAEFVIIMREFSNFTTPNLSLMNPYCIWQRPISEAQVDAINLPMYFTSDKEREELIERNVFLSIEMVRVGEPLV